MCRICVTGIFVHATASGREPVSFCIVRFLLVPVEAGFIPHGAVRPIGFASTRARFIVCSSASRCRVIIADPSQLLTEHHLPVVMMLILEGIPSLIRGVATLRMLPDGPAKAKWLSADEKASLPMAGGEPPGALHGLKECCRQGIGS